MEQPFDTWRRDIFALYGQQQYRQALNLLAAPPQGLTEDQRGEADFWAACLHSLLGESEAAVQALQRVNQRGHWLAPLRLESDPDLDAIRELPQVQALLSKWQERLRTEQDSVRPELTVLHARTPVWRTLVVLHMNSSSTAATQPRFADLTGAGWRVALVQSGQLGGPGAFIWNNAVQADREVQTWAAELAGKPLWAGLSAGGHVALRNVLTGKVPASGVLAVVPSIPAEPAWWPDSLPGVPIAFILGEQDSLTANARLLADRLQGAGQPVRVWMHPGGHDLPLDWLGVRNEALAWLSRFST